LFTSSHNSSVSIITSQGPTENLAGATSALSATQTRSASIRVIPLHVPVNRPVIAELSSKDVIHDYFVPAMRIGGDAIPGSLIPIWFTPLKTGTYEVICAQLCGLGHYGMKGTLVVDTPQDYEAWLKERAELAGGAQPASSPGAPQQPQNKLPQAAGKPEQQPAQPAQSPGQL